MVNAHNQPGRPRLSIPQFVQLVKYMLIIHFSVARIKAMKLATQDTFSKALIVRQHMEQNSELGPLFYLDDDEEDEDDTYYSSDYVDEDEYYEDHVEYKFPDE
jgi:hypothetical protein